MSTMAQRIANIFEQQVKCGTKNDTETSPKKSLHRLALPNELPKSSAHRKA